MQGRATSTHQNHLIYTMNHLIYTMNYLIYTMNHLIYTMNQDNTRLLARFGGLYKWT